MLIFSSWHRPGAATNALLTEFGTVKQETQGKKVVHVMKVKDHKTGISGATRTVMTGTDYSRLDSYVSTIRPRLLGGNTSDNLLILEGGGKVVNFNQRLRKVCTFFGMPHMTATRARKIAATVSATRLDPTESSALVRQLSHSVQTDAQHYQLLASSSHAAKAFCVVILIVHKSILTLSIQYAC